MIEGQRHHARVKSRKIGPEMFGVGDLNVAELRALAILQVVQPDMGRDEKLTGTRSSSPPWTMMVGLPSSRPLARNSAIPALHALRLRRLSGHEAAQANRPVEVIVLRAGAFSRQTGSFAADRSYRRR
jgi:hypothetical protein